MKIQKIRSLAIVTVIIALVTLSGCIGQTEEEGRKKLIIVTTIEPAILDTQVATTNWLPNMQIAQPLFQFSMDGSTLIPDALESWEASADGLTMTWHLRPGYKYSNGDALDAAALDASIWRYYNDSPYGDLDLYSLDTTEVVDENTLVVNFTEPPANTFYVLSTVYLAPWNQAEVQRIGAEQFGQNPVASGPFKFKEWVVGSHIDLERNDEYKTSNDNVVNKGPVHLEELTIRFITEDLTRLSEFEAGSVDIIESVPTADIERLKADPDIDMYGVADGCVNLYYNTQRPPFDDVRMREAIAHAINREDYSKVLSGAMVPVYSPVWPAAICYSQEMDDYAKNSHPYDVAAGKAALADLGWTDSDGDGFVDKGGENLEMTLLVASDDPPRLNTGIVIQEQIKAIGIDCKVETYEHKVTYNIMAEDGDYDLGLGSVGWPDPDMLGWQWEPHYQGYEDGEPFQEVYLQSRSKVDLEERTAVVAEAQKILIDELAWIPLFSPQKYWAVQSWVKDFKMHPQRGTLYLNDITIAAEGNSGSALQMLVVAFFGRDD